MKNGERLRQKLPQEVVVKIQEQQQEERGGKYWTLYNSPLLPPSTDGVPDYSFQLSLKSVISEKQNLKEHIEDTLVAKAGNVLALEIGGPGSALFAGFAKEFIAESRGVTLVDNRKLEEIAVDPTDDASRNHDVIAGNILEASTKSEVLKWLGGRNLDLILERMRGGLELLPRDPRYLLREVSFWYSVLARDGLLIAEVPEAFNDDLELWAVEARKANLDVTLGDTLHYDANNDTDLIRVVRIYKGENAPEEFPFLRQSE